MTEDEKWLNAVWPFVRANVPLSTEVLEVGCGPLGGFVPALRRDGHEATGVDPRPPSGPCYHRLAFEQYKQKRQVDVVIASTSLHHVADLDLVLDKITAALAPRGKIIVVEWAWERVDEATAGWCFERLDPASSPSWLSARRDEWQAAGGTWASYFTAWANGEGLHPSDKIRRALDERFQGLLSAVGPYFFPDLTEVSDVAEQSAIDSAITQPAAIRFVGRLR